MRTLTILCASIALFVLGVVIEDRGFAVGAGEAGELIYPLSSGGEGGLLLKVGLYPFILSFLSAAISLVGRGKGRATFGIFFVCSILYFLWLFWFRWTRILLSQPDWGIGCHLQRTQYGWHH